MLKFTALVALLSLALHTINALPTPASSDDSNIEDEVSPSPPPPPVRLGRGRAVNQMPVGMISQHYEVPGTVQNQPALINIYNQFQHRPGTGLEEVQGNPRHLSTLAVRVGTSAAAGRLENAQFRGAQTMRERRANRNREQRQARAQAQAEAAIHPTVRIDRQVPVNLEAYQRALDAGTYQSRPEVHRPVAAFGRPGVPYQPLMGAYPPIGALQQHNDPSAFYSPAFVGGNTEASSSYVHPQQFASFHQGHAGESSSMARFEQGSSSGENLHEHDLLSRFNGGEGYSNHGTPSGMEIDPALDQPRQEGQRGHHADVDTNLSLGRNNIARRGRGW